MKRCLPVLAIFFLTTSISVASDNFINGLNEFAFDLYKKTNANENRVISPYSLSAVLSIILAGSANKTQQQIMHLLHQNNNKNIIAGLAQIDNALLNNNADLNVANALWADNHFNYLSTFTDQLKDNNFSQFFTVNFKEQPESARKQINDWVEDRTHAYIKDLLTPGSITNSTLLVITNAVYFKGMWQHAFKKNATDNTPFAGKQMVAMMHQTEKYLYMENKDLQLLIMPYKNSTLKFIVLLPKNPKTFSALEKTLTLNQFFKFINAATLQKISVSLPKFMLQTTLNNLKQSLQSLGMRDAFTSNANFSLISKDKLIISDVIQKAMIKIDEEGTVAAAASSTIMVGSIYEPTIEFNANHPFLFFIVDDKTKAILFMGKLIKP